MVAVTFNFRPEATPEEQDEVLQAISAWREVQKASRLKPEAKHPLLLRMAYANVDDSADVDGVVERLARLPQVEGTSVPPKRRLA
jgi:hypothetical protein